MQTLEELKQAADDARATLDADGELVRYGAALEQTSDECATQLQQRTAELEIINSVQQGLASKLDMQGIYDLVGDKIREIFDAQGIFINLYDPQSKRFNRLYNFERGKRLQLGAF